MVQYPTKVYLDNAIVDQKDAKISVFDRGFLFGDGVYEVMVQLDGAIFFEEEHLDRLADSLKKTEINFDTESVPEKVRELLHESDLSHEDCLIYIQVTRGTAPRKHSFPKNTEASFMMYATPITLPKINQTHAEVITMPDFRWSRCDIKMISLLGNVMANDDARKKGAYEALLFREGNITEASHCNVFFVKENIVYTHPANQYILNGITRKIVIKLCDDLDLEVREEALSQDDITKADEAFLTGTTTQIVSIRQIDNYYLYDGENVGPITQKLQSAFYELRTKLEPVN